MHVNQSFPFKLQFHLKKVWEKTAAEKLLSPSRITPMSRLTHKWLTAARQGLANVATKASKLSVNCGCQD